MPIQPRLKRQLAGAEEIRYKPGKADRGGAHGKVVRSPPRQWERIKDFLLGKVTDRGRLAADTRQFVNGALWVLRSEARWCDLPDRYGNWQSVHKRFTRWARVGVWERVAAFFNAARLHTGVLA